MDHRHPNAARALTKTLFCFREWGGGCVLPSGRCARPSADPWTANIRSKVVVLQVYGTNRPGALLPGLDTLKILIRQAQGDAPQVRLRPPPATRVQRNGRSGEAVAPLVGVKAWIGFPVPGMLGLTMTARCRPAIRRVRLPGSEPERRQPPGQGHPPTAASTSLSQGEGGHSHWHRSQQRWRPTWQDQVLRDGAWQTADKKKSLRDH